jgi:hypothetical protein
MSGWKTWLAVIGMIMYAVFYEGVFLGNWANAVQLILAALALIGIGSKLDKVKKY